MFFQSKNSMLFQFYHMACTAFDASRFRINLFRV